jgi:hypothetical protein
MTTDRLAIALAHAKAGRAVFPFQLIRRMNGSVDKKPLVQWQTTADHETAATTDSATIRRWWRRWPDAWPGWVLPEGVIVADLDDRDAFSATGLVLPEAPSQQTVRGGEHRLYLGTGRQTVKRVPGLDTRVGGKGWVALYSADAFAGEPTAAPAWLLADRQNGADAPIDGSSPAIEAIRDGQLTIRAGERDSTLASIAGSLIARGGSAGSTVLALELLNAAGAIEQPHGDRIGPDDFRRIARSIADTEARKQKAAHEELVVVPLTEVEEREPLPLRLGKLDPEDHTILFGDGGTGKGVVASDWVAQLSRDGERVLILDFERHARYEWRPRVHAFGGELDRVHIAQPTSAIWDVAEQIVAAIEAYGITWVFVDSVGWACIGVDIEKSATAIRYSAAISTFERPTVSIAHTTKANADPQHPFGSVYWSNACRITIGMAGRGDEPRTLTNRKTNQRAAFPPVEIDWSWSASNKLPESLTETTHSASAAERAYAVLLHNGPMTTNELYARVLDDGGPDVDQRVLRNALNRRTDLFKKDAGLWTVAIEDPKARYHDEEAR